MTDPVSSFYQQLQSDRIVFGYKGFLDRDLHHALLRSFELEMNAREHNTTTKKKLFNVVVECLQNALVHCDEMTQGEDNAGNFIILLVTNDGAEYCVRTGNTVRNRKVAELNSWLETLNILSPHELRTAYRQILSRGERNEKGMAGLGFIDIARKSDQPLEYMFDPIDDEFSIFSFCIRLSKNTSTNPIETWNH